MKAAEINQEEVQELMTFFDSIKDKKYIMSPNTIMLAVKKVVLQSKIHLTKQQEQDLAYSVHETPQVVVTIGSNVNWIGLGDKVLISPQYNLIAYAIPINITEFPKYNFWVVEPGSAVSLILEKYE